LSIGALFSLACWAADEGLDQKKPAAKMPAADTKPPPVEFTLSLEQLMNIQVTSVSKTPEKARQAAAAVYVITGEDIRRSGATSIAEALRMAPGLEVARLTGNRWAISSRGFNDILTNKLLVLIDGRSVYSPLFAGVFWGVQDTLLEDIERIEVVRGPGATLWGANAVNGVINVITKSAKDTQGGLVSAGGGTEELGFGAVRYGGKIGQNVAIRGYVKYFDRDDQALANGKDAFDEWQMGRGGFRLDWDAAPDDRVMFQGDAYAGSAGEAAQAGFLTPPFSRQMTGHGDIAGGDVLGRWTHTFTPSSSMQMQLYYDRTDREDVGVVHRELCDTVDFDFQHQFSLGERQKVVWGAGYRLVADSVDPGALASFNPASRTTNLFSAFVQDEISLLKDKLALTVGSKFEHNDFSGFEIQPSARLLWTPQAHHTIWASVSRAVRCPARADQDLRAKVTALPPGAIAPGSPVALVSLFGDKDFKSEQLLAYELGYRVQPHSKLSLDFAGFYNVYDDLATREDGAPFPERIPAPPHLVVPRTLANKMDGQNCGGEAVVTWQAQKWWRLSANYSFLSMHLHPDRGSTNTLAENAERESPRNQVMLRSLMDLPRNVALDVALRYVDRLPAIHVPAYIEGDVRVGWKPTKKLELSLVGQNLFDNQHPEFHRDPTFPSTEVQRSVYLKVMFKF
jgi:iron complex outermembrane receptor protein